MSIASSTNLVATGFAAGFYGGFWRRLGAYIIDAIIIAIIASMLETVLEAVNSPGIIALFVYLGLAYGYYVHLIYKDGATLGKRMLRLQVVNLQGKQVSFKQAWLRITPYIVMYILPLLIIFAIMFMASTETSPEQIIGMMTLIIIGYGTLCLLWYIASIVQLLRNPHKRTLHDLLARTVVVYNPPKHIPVTHLPLR